MILQGIRKSVALKAPVLGRIVRERDVARAERDAAVQARDAARHEQSVAIAERDAARTERETARREWSRATRAAFDAFLRGTADGSFVAVALNDAPLQLPVDTLRTMVHCLEVNASGGLSAYVETAHLRWMMQRLEGGGTFLDVGASTGATTLPIAARFGDGVRIVAYEPAPTARRLLLATLERNGIHAVTVRPVAVSDVPGEVEFRQYFPDETGETPYLPEVSTIVAPRMLDRPHETVRVPVVTLDDDALPLLGRRPIVCKIDVEGFETLVLRGATRLLSNPAVHLSIDIHYDPFRDGKHLTEPDVRDILSPLGYSFETMGHVLLCSPPR